MAGTIQSDSFPKVQTLAGLPSRLSWQIAILVAVALIFGGGGVAYGLANLVVQLTALTLLALHRDAAFAFWRDAPLLVRGLVGTTILLPIVQLVPLPHAIWASLPGRELAVEARMVVGAEGWHPVSLNAARTLVAGSGLIVPVTILALGCRLPDQALRRIAWVIVAFGFANLLVGASQVLAPSQARLLYPENPMSGVLFGLFANRNSTGIFLVVCLSLLLFVEDPRGLRRGALIKAAASAGLITAILLTQSRSAIVLSLVPVTVATLRGVWRLFPARGKAISIGVGTVAVIAFAATVAGGLQGTRATEALERFSQSGDAREYIWEDAAFSAAKYWPAGAGMGTFDDVFQVDESLENLTERRAGRAHNDYLEIVVEAGLVGLLLAGAWFIVTGWIAWRSRRSPLQGEAIAGSISLGVIALQSLVDYPLRNQAMLAVAAFAFLLLMRAFLSTQEQSS